MATEDMSNASTGDSAIAAAQRYIHCGWNVIPLPHRSKKCRSKGWQKWRIKLEDLDRWFPAGKPRNIAGQLDELLKSNRELRTQASYLATKADSERHRASRELKAEDRDQRLEQATNFEKQSKSLEQRIKANEKAQEELVKRREGIESQMRAW